jgi:glucose/arabinose dehydrogenase
MFSQGIHLQPMQRQLRSISNDKTGCAQDASALVLRKKAGRIRPVKITAFQFRNLALIPLACVLAATSSASAAAGDKPFVGLQPVAEGFTSPLTVLSLDDGSGRLLIADQVGPVHVLNKDGMLSEQLFLDLRSRMTKLNQGFDERGLLGLALHPRFKANRKLYVYYSAPRSSTAPTNWDHTSHISEFKVMADDYARVDPASERVLLKIDQPQFNHNGGRLLFGPDGFLYIGTGDGGGANDGVGSAQNEIGHSPQGNGQDTTTLLGKILRIDVDKGSPYAIPSDNPFADGKQGRPEIYSYGWRNPWGLSFDRGDAQEFFAADVGQNLYEELNIVVKGGNYGWRVREARVAFDPRKPDVSPAESPKADALGKPFIDPILWYEHPARNKIDPTKLEGISITGGYVYRGKAIKELQGKYVFADWSRSWALPDGVFFTATREGKGRDSKWNLEPLPVAPASGGKLGAYIVSFGEDEAGELYVMTNGRNSLTGQTGKVFKLVPN